MKLSRWNAYAALVVALSFALVAFVATPGAQQARYSVSGGDVSCTTQPSLYRGSDPNQDTGYGIDSSGTCTAVDGVKVESTSATTKLLPALVQVGGTSGSFPGLKRDGTRLLARLANDSSDTNLGVLDDAYAAGWNGSVNVPTKNAIYDANFVQAPAGGYNLNRGTTALDGSNPTPVASGLPALTACTATIQGTSAPGVGTSVVTVAISGTTLNVYAWKPTSSSDTTLIASTGTEVIQWVCLN